MPETPPPFDGRPSIRIDNTMPENPKIVGLSDAAFRLYIEAICWCSRQEVDGLIPAAAMKRMGRPRIITELVKEGLLLDTLGTYLIHDYLSHQRSKQEITAFRASRRHSGQKGAHMRWHVPRREFVKDCAYCQGTADE
jgi:hypothetical protein